MNTPTIQFSDLLKQAITMPGIISKAYSAFHNFSIGNQQAAIGQCMARGLDIGPIATFKAWQDLGRCVTKGQKALTLCMPVTMKTTRKNEQTGQDEIHSFNRFMWRNNWFVLSQTDGQDYQHEVKTPAWCADTALQNLGINQVSFSETNGNCQGYAIDQSIAINPVAAFPHKTRFHELAHVVLGHTKEHMMTDSEQTPRDVREVQAESVAYILCSILGLPGLDESRGYIQGWLSGADVQEKTAHQIFSTADKILKAGQLSI
jgi:antirestriction protein ArdC